MVQLCICQIPKRGLFFFASLPRRFNLYLGRKNRCTSPPFLSLLRRHIYIIPTDRIVSFSFALRSRECSFPHCRRDETSPAQTSNLPNMGNEHEQKKVFSTSHPFLAAREKGKERRGLNSFSDTALDRRKRDVTKKFP